MERHGRIDGFGGRPVTAVESTCELTRGTLSCIRTQRVHAITVVNGVGGIQGPTVMNGPWRPFLRLRWSKPLLEMEPAVRFGGKTLPSPFLFLSSRGAIVVRSRKTGSVEMFPILPDVVTERCNTLKLVQVCEHRSSTHKFSPVSLHRACSR